MQCIKGIYEGEVMSLRRTVIEERYFKRVLSAKLRTRNKKVSFDSRAHGSILYVKCCVRVTKLEAQSSDGPDSC